MIGLRKSLGQVNLSRPIIQASNKNFSSGGEKPKPIDPKIVDFDVVFVGKHFSNFL